MAYNPQKVVQWYRENQLDTRNATDYDLYERAMRDFPQIRKELEEVGNPFDPSPMQPIVTEKSEQEADYSPAKLEGLTSMLNLADTFADEGVPSLGLSPEFFKKAYNESLAGMTYSIANGKFKYDIGDYEPSMTEEVFQFVAGTLNPIDAISFFALPMGGAKVGTSLAQKTLAKWGTQAAADGAKKKIVQNNLKSSIYEGILQTGLGFGAYSSAAGAISSASQQAVNPETGGKIDGWKVAKDATASGLEGIAMGAIAGGASKAIGNRYARWEVANGDATNLQKRTRKTLNVLGQIGVEAGAFTSIPYFIHGVPKDEDGTIGWEQVGKQLVADFALDAIIRSSTGDIFRQANQDLQQYSKALGREVKSKIDNNDQLNKSIRNVVGDAPESAPIFREAQAEDLNKIISIKDGVDKLLEDTNRALELSNKPEAELTDIERLELVSYVKSMNEIKGLYLETLENPDLQRQLGIELMSPETEAILKSKIKTIDTASKLINNLDQPKTKTVEVEDKPVAKTKVTFEQKVDAMDENQLISTYAKQRNISPQEARKELTLKSEKGDIFDEQTAKSFIKAEKQDTQKLVEEVVKGVTGFDINESVSRAKGLIDKGAAKTRYNEFKDSVSENDALALGEYALENSSYSKQMGKYLSWLKKNKGLEYKDSSKELVYEYLNDVILASPKKNKIVGNDIAPFSKFDQFAKKKWVTDRRHEGLSFTEANEARFEPVVEREIPSTLLDNIRKNRKSATKDLVENFNISKEEVDFIYELTKRGIRPSELNKINADNFKVSDDGRYYIDFGAEKKAQSKFRLKVLIPKDVYDYGKTIKKGFAKRTISIGKGKPRKALQKLVAEKLTGDANASVKDMRNAYEQLKINLPEDVLTQQQLDAYLGHLTGTDNKAIYKITRLPLNEQLDIARKVEKALNIVDDTKIKSK